MCKRIVFFKAINGGTIIPQSAVSTALPLADNAFQRLSGRRDSNPRPSAWEAGDNRRSGLMMESVKLLNRPRDIKEYISIF